MKWHDFICLNSNFHSECSMCEGHCRDHLFSTSRLRLAVLSKSRPSFRTCYRSLWRAGITARLNFYKAMNTFTLRYQLPSTCTWLYVKASLSDHCLHQRNVISPLLKIKGWIGIGTTPFSLITLCLDSGKCYCRKLKSLRYAQKHDNWH